MSTCSQNTVSMPHLWWSCGVHTCTLTQASLLLLSCCKAWSLGCHIITHHVMTSHLGFLQAPQNIPSRWSFCATWWSSCQSKFWHSCCALTWHNIHVTLTTKTMCWSHSCDFMVITQHLCLGGVTFWSSPPPWPRSDTVSLLWSCQSALHLNPTQKGKK